MHAARLASTVHSGESELPPPPLVVFPLLLVLRLLGSYLSGARNRSAKMKGYFDDSDDDDNPPPGGAGAG